MSDFQKWSVLAFRAMDDAGRVLMTIEPESTTEGERLDQLKETIRELLVQALVLNGVTTRRQMDKQFQFGKLDTDALNVQLGQEQQAEPVQEPVAWMYTGVKQDGIEHGPHLVWKPEYMDAMSASKGAKATPLYTTPPQRKPFDLLVITTAYEQGVGKGHQAHRRSAEIENPYAPGECQQAWALGYDEGKEQAASKAAHGIKEQP